MSKLCSSIVNSWSERGLKFPVTDGLQWTIGQTTISHKDGYLYVHATPNFEQIDLFKLAQDGMQEANITFTDLFEMVFSDQYLSNAASNITDVIGDSEQIVPPDNLLSFNDLLDQPNHPRVQAAKKRVIKDVMNKFPTHELLALYAEIQKNMTEKAYKKPTKAQDMVSDFYAKYDI